MKRVLGLSLVCASLAMGCGGGDGGDDLPNAGFVTPDVVTEAWLEEGGVWVSKGAPDWTCLNGGVADPPSTTAITLTGKIEDFQTGNKVPGANIEAFRDVDFANPFDNSTSEDNTAEFTLTLPVGVTRVGYKITADGTLDTYQLNFNYDPANDAQTEDLNSVSELTANALPAFIGVTRTAGLGIIAGSIRDCQNREISGAVATLSSVSGMPEHVPGAVTYYFSAGATSLPVRHQLQATTNTDSLYVIIEVPPTGTAFLQIWGFVDAADLADGEMTLLGEIPSPIVADSVVTSSVDPLQ